jgi:hypothetical protein
LNLLGQAAAVTLRVFQGRFEDQVGDRVVLSRIGLAAEPQGLQGDAAPTCHAVEHFGRAVQVTLTYFLPHSLEEQMATWVPVMDFPPAQIQQLLSREGTLR